MRLALDLQAPATGRRLRLLAIIASLLAIVVTFTTADTTYEAFVSAMPCIALASIATAITYERRSRRSTSLDRVPRLTAAHSTTRRDATLVGTDAA